MKKSKYSEQQILAPLKEAAGQDMLSYANYLRGFVQ